MLINTGMVDRQSTFIQRIDNTVGKIIDVK